MLEQFKFVVFDGSLACCLNPSFCKGFPCPCSTAEAAEVAIIEREETVVRQFHGVPKGQQTSSPKAASEAQHARALSTSISLLPSLACSSAAPVLPPLPPAVSLSAPLNLVASASKDVHMNGLFVDESALSSTASLNSPLSASRDQDIAVVPSSTSLAATLSDSLAAVPCSPHSSSAVPSLNEVASCFVGFSSDIGIIISFERDGI